MTSPASLQVVFLGYGESFHVQRLASELVARGHRPRIVTGSRHAPQGFSDCPVHLFDSDRPLPLKILEVRKILRELRPDLVHSHYISHGGYIGLMSGYHPHVASAWGDDIWLSPGFSWKDSRLIPATLRAADLVLPVSPGLDTEIRRLTKNRVKSEVWHWGVDTARFSHSERDAAEQRAKLGISAETPLVYCPRLLFPDYNQDRLVAAWPEVAKAVPEARLLLKRAPGSPEYEEKLKAQAAYLGVGSKLLWLDSLAYEKLPASYAAADLIATMPDTEGTPITVLESFACETPVLAVSIEAVRDWVVPGTTGFLAERDPKSVGAALVEALRTPRAKLREMGRAGRAMVVERADQKRCFDELERIYARVITASR